MSWEAKSLTIGRLKTLVQVVMLIGDRFDPSRFILEHYVDGDLVNDETPTSRHKAGPGNLHVWGKFEDPRLTTILIPPRSGGARNIPIVIYVYVYSCLCVMSVIGIAKIGVGFYQFILLVAIQIRVRLPSASFIIALSWIEPRLIPPKTQKSIF
jgi:hypothetical protein